MKIVVIALVLISPLLVFAQTQKCTDPSPETDEVSQGANQIVEYSTVYKVKKMAGIVSDPAEAGLNAIIDVYAVKSLDKKAGPGHLITGITPFKRYRGQINGKFCIEGLHEGDYVLKIGAAGGGFNFTLIKVRLTKYGSRRPILIGLTLGT
jgi:hypothetical protein